MAIRNFRPYTPGTRTRVVTDFSEFTSRKPERPWWWPNTAARAATTAV